MQSKLRFSAAEIARLLLWATQGRDGFPRLIKHTHMILNSRFSANSICSSQAWVSPKQVASSAVERGWRCGSVVQCLLSMHKNLGLISSTIKKKK
jgi:hypothetical protein